MEESNAHQLVLCALYLLTECSHAAQGGEEQGGMRIFAPSQQQSVKDLPSQTKLKFRCHAGEEGDVGA